jgi:Ca-activated chloride channel family protein
MTCALTRCGLALIAVTAATLFVGGQAFRSEIDGVVIPVAVTRGGAPVADLTAQNFVVTDNGVVQDVTAELLGVEPLRLSLLLDISASVSGKRLASLVSASRSLVLALQPEDQLSLTVFAHGFESLVPMGRDRRAALDALTGLSGSGATALRDALYVALMTTSDERSLTLLLLFSDGHDTASFLTEDIVLEIARRSNAVVHAVHVRPDPFLGRLTQATGGRMWSVQSDRQLQELFGRVMDEMRARYLLTYSPTGPRTAGWHQVKVSLKGARGDVTAKPGYFVE